MDEMTEPMEKGGIGKSIGLILASILISPFIALYAIFNPVEAWGVLKELWGKGYKVEIIVAVIVCTFITACIAVAIVGAATAPPPPTPTDVVEIAHIYSLQDGGSLGGSFFLGIGSFNQRPVYAYYEIADDGALYFKTINTDGVAVYMDENESPYLKKILIKGNIWDRRYELHVPENTVIKEYLLDGKLN